MSRSSSCATPLLALLAVFAALHGWTRPASFVAAPPRASPGAEGHGRRAAALSVALPVVGGLPSQSRAEADGREVVQSGSFAFTLPAGSDFKLEPSDAGSAAYVRKDGAVILVGPMLPGFLDSVLLEATQLTIRGPPGHRILTNTRSETLDELVIDEYAQAPEGAIEGPFTIIGLGRKTSWRYWFRNVKQGDKGVLMRIIVPLKTLEREEAAMVDVLNSLRLA